MLCGTMQQIVAGRMMSSSNRSPSCSASPFDPLESTLWLLHCKLGSVPEFVCVATPRTFNLKAQYIVQSGNHDKHFVVALKDVAL